MRYEGNVYRPPGEWRSYLLQATIGCSNNTCTFCGMYKDKNFRIRPLKDVLEDIEMAKRAYKDVEKIFICDGDAIAIKTQDLITIITKLKEAFPDVRLISTYAGPRSTLSKTPAELSALREAGLGRAYLGIESGDDVVLKHTCKGATAGEMLQAGRNLIEAGIDLWGTVLVGLGGTERSREHILATAELINKMKPQHISSMTYTPVEDTELYDEIQAGKFKVLTARQCLEETKLLLENINIDDVHFTSDHASNYLSLKGTVKQDAPKIIALIDGALSGDISIRSEWSRGL